MTDFKYQRLARQIAQELLGGVWRAQAPLPPEQRLQQRYGASRTTVRRALALLQQQGLLEKGQGRVSRVASPVVVKPLSELADFHTLVRASGKTPQTHVLAYGLSGGSLQTDVYFDAGQGQPVLLRRRRLVDRQPVVYQRVYLPHRVWGCLQRRDLENASLYLLLAQRLNQPVVSVTDVVSACEADAETAQALAVKEGEVLIQADRLGWGAGGDVLEVSRAYVRPSNFQFSATSVLGA